MITWRKMRKSQFIYPSAACLSKLTSGFQRKLFGTQPPLLHPKNCFSFLVPFSLNLINFFMHEFLEVSWNNKYLITQTERDINNELNKNKHLYDLYTIFFALIHTSLICINFLWIRCQGYSHFTEETEPREVIWLK